MWFFLLALYGLAEDCDDDSLQSPIDIVSPFIYKDPSIQFYLGYQERTILYHDGYNLRIDGDFGGFTWEDSYFWSYELVFKQPSEHTLEGDSMPMEMQVHFIDQFGNLAVIVALFSNSTESTFLDEIGFGNPQLRDAHDGSLFKIDDSVDVSALLGYPENYLYYEGSTTVSPCKANVTWIILTSTYRASPEQLDNFPSDLFGVIRSTQPLNGRTIYCNFEEASEEGTTVSVSADDETLIQEISSGESFKEVNDDFIVESESYLDDFPQVNSIFMSG